MKVNASNLRKDIYRLLDSVLESGRPLEIERNGKYLKIVRELRKGSKVSRLVKHDCVDGDPEVLVHPDWSGLWTPGEV